jgi:hypothetical protein
MIGGPFMLTQTMSNVQQELLKLYATNIEDSDLLLLKKLLSNFFASRSIKNADKIWTEKNFTSIDMDRWLNE